MGRGSRVPSPRATVEPSLRLRCSGGLNAPLIAEIVGPSGRVVSVDIDPEVTEL
jgi:hypothetical protein